jgi:phosphate transport system substrate-binding protein
VNEVAPARQERPADTARAASSGAVVAEAPASQVVAGIAVAGEGIRSIEGVGVAFPSPIYQTWSREYLRSSGVSVDYVLVGGGASLKLLLNRGVTFATTDNPISGEDLKASGLFQFPVVAGGVVPIVRLDGVTASQIKLDGWTLARIYLGEISHWSDPPIQKLNPGLGLPNTRITLAYRLDGSLSTQVLTGYLSSYNNWFKSRYGVRTQIDVSPGAAVRGDNGMLDFVQRTDGAIGYVDYRYARQQGIESIRLINKVGNAVPATPESLQSAVSHAEWIVAPGFGASLLDLSGEKTWPMTYASFVVMQSRVNRPQTAAAVQFFDWAYRNGTKAALEQGYVTMPPTVAKQVRAMWANAIGRAVPTDPDTKDAK